MSEDRWAFIQRNRLADAIAHLRRLDVPFLALWGREDLNVDAVHDATIYRDLLERGHSANRVSVLPKATHGLLKAGPFNYQLVDDWPWHAKVRFLLEGRHAYAPGALDRIAGWITARAIASARKSEPFAHTGD